MSAKLLEARKISIRFGGLKAVDSLDFSINQGELMGLIGPNGAGKTTVFNMLTGVYQPTEGEVIFNGQAITGLRPYQVSRLGMTRTFQNIRLFKDLTVLENVMVGGAQHQTYGVLAPVLQTKEFKHQEEESRTEALKLLKIFDLEKKMDLAATGLPYGEQRKVEIVRALATRPKMICLDEPAAGLNHSETEDLMNTIAKIRKDFNLTVLLIEHDMKLVMGICERILVLDHGCKIEEGSPAVVQGSKKVIEAYLGVSDVDSLKSQDAPLFLVENLQVFYGSIQAIKGISFKVNQGEVVSLIGANGAGKTTTLKAISGMLSSKGKMQFQGKDLQAVAPHLRVTMGLAQSPEGRGVFPQMSVLENMELGAYFRNDKIEIQKDIQNCFELFPRLKEREKQMAGTLSGGEQQMLAISRALMSKPTLLLLDEPSLGLAPLVVAQIFEIIKKVNGMGMTVLLVEQNARMALKVSHRAYVIETGTIVLEGKGSDLLNDDNVRKAYLGI